MMILGQCTSSKILRICICMPVHLVTIQVRSGTQPMRALGTTIEIPRREALSRFEYYLPLTDTLAYGPDPSGHLRELSDSFGHDILNLATLASRLLWYEGVVPLRRRPHELVAVSVDSETYFVMLQTACDIMADVVSTVRGVKRSTPFESFHKLNQWALRHPGGVNAGFEFLSSKFAWFDQINAVRTKLVHRGGDSWIYTEGRRFHWDIMLPGKKVRLGTFLLSLLQNLTGSLLAFSGVLAERVMRRIDLQRLPNKTVISGAYVPGLHHLLEEYTVPRRLGRTVNAQCLAMCQGYVEAACLGYPDGFWWQLLVDLGEALGVPPGTDDSSKFCSNAIFDCKFVFAVGDHRYGVVACEEVRTGDKWLQGAAASAAKFSGAQKLSRTVMVGRTSDPDPPEFLPGDEHALVVDDDPHSAAVKVLARFGTGKSVPG